MVGRSWGVRKDLGSKRKRSGSLNNAGNAASHKALINHAVHHGSMNSHQKQAMRRDIFRSRLPHIREVAMD